MTGLAGGGSAAVGEGSKGALAAARLLDTAANAVSGAATVGRAGATVGGAVHTRKSDHARAAAEMQKGRAEIAQAHVADAVGDVRSSEQSFARAMAAMKAMQDANGEALRSSVRMRG
ncbi:MAG: hypothetical protein IPK60_18025 [Sandaracinaceae bacterium]|nr:hypothetical protein [Sandaracinaceae bacterium]